jgi:DNA helicase-2/ATP-dependent DNA helicase PcrA
VQTHAHTASIRSRFIESKTPSGFAPPSQFSSEGLNPQQAEAVGFDHARDGAVLVLAGAGSGKTTVLTRRVARLVSAGAARGILALTFTADAAEEMEARVRALIPAIATAAPGTPAASFHTFHAFAFRLIRSEWEGCPNWRRLGFAACPALLEAGTRRAWLAAERETAAADGAEAGEAPASIEALEARVADPFAAPGPAGPEDPLRERFRARLLAQGLAAFDDMVSLALRLLRGHADVLAGLRERIDHVLVDEFQDTSPDQLELVRVIMGDRRSLFLVGDDDQSIYGFRGADPGNLEQALGAFPGMRVLKLETNYRSSAPIVAYANAIFADKPGPLRKTLRPGRELAPVPVRVMVQAEGMDQARWIVAELARLRAAGLAWNQIAILYRLNSLEPYYRSMLARLVGEDAAAQVVLKTVHGSKGLQWPAVFLVGLEDGILPYHRPAAIPSPETLGEERRIFYVGVTRAERYLYLCACRRRMLRGKPRDFKVSPFLAGRFALGRFGDAGRSGGPGRWWSGWGARMRAWRNTFRGVEAR